jgi:hypothetical protein
MMPVMMMMIMMMTILMMMMMMTAGEAVDVRGRGDWLHRQASATQATVQEAPALGA